MRKGSRWLGAYAGLVYLFLYAPIAILVVFSFNRSRQTAVWEGFTTEWYRSLAQNDLILGALKNSLIVGGAATLVATVLGTLVALALGRHTFRGEGFTRQLLYLPVIIPEIVLGAALVTFFGVLAFRLSLTTVILAHVVFCVSYVAIVVRARLAGFDRSLEEAALDLGARPLPTFFRVTLPLLAPGIVAGALLSFTISIDDYVITSFVAGVGSTTLPLQIYSMLKVGVTPEVNAVSALILGVTVVLIAIAQRLQRPPAERGGVLSRTAALLASLAVLVSCGPRPGEAPYPGPGEKKLNVYIWSEYLPKEVIDEFTRRTGIAVSYDLYDSNEAVLAKLESGVADYDLVVPSDYMVRILIHQGLLRPLERGRLRHFGNLDPRFLDRGFDPKNAYSLPYVWGTTGYGYDRTKVSGNPDSWAPLFDPRNKGQILMLDDMRECFAVALKYQGRSLNSTDPQVLRAAADLLEKQKPLVKTYNSGDYENILASGDVWLSHGYNGQLAKVVARDPARFAYVLPKEGATLWIDSVCLPARARNVESIYAFLDYILEPEVNAKIVDGIRYASPNAAARKFIDPKILADPAVYPSDEALARCELIEDIGDATTTMDEYWTEIKMY